MDATDLRLTAVEIDGRKVQEGGGWRVVRKKERKRRCHVSGCWMNPLSLRLGDFGF